ncbi:MAG: dihydrofolate reductase [Chloroflexota bacterium]
MRISLIVALDEDRGIGKAGQLPWRLRTDLQRFKRLTMGHHLLMGRKTWLSIGKALPGRTNLVISRDPAFQAPGCQVLPSLQAALDLARQSGEDECFVIGGGEIFRQALPLADRIYLTRVHTRAGCDVFFPPFEMADWVASESSFQPASPQDNHPSTFQILSRRPAAQAGVR